MRRGRSRRPGRSVLRGVALAISCTLLLARAVLPQSRGIARLTEQVALAERQRQPGGDAPRATLADRLDEHSESNMLGHVRALADQIGPRGAGSDAERRAGDYILDELGEIGVQARVQDRIAIGLTGTSTRNIETVLPGAGEGALLLGAHYDSVVGRKASPGANDNASGVAVLLEIARVLRTADLPCDVRLVFFGAEEFCGSPPLHHVGSNYYVRKARDADLARIRAMLSVDMVGLGAPLHANRIGLGTDEARRKLSRAADRVRVDLSLADSFPYGDHEAFELAGIPAVCLTQFGDDPHWHSDRDGAASIEASALMTAARLCLCFLDQYAAAEP